MSDTNCPFCGEPEETDTPSGITIYRCGTLIYPNNSSVKTLICDLGKDLRREREAHNNTKRERDEAREENAKLISIADMARAKLTALRTHQDRSIRELVSKERAVNSLLRQLDGARARLHPDRALEWLRVHYQSWFGDRTEWSDDIADRFYRDTATLTLFCQNFKFSKEGAK
jgi:hypothetical protein